MFWAKLLSRIEDGQEVCEDMFLAKLLFKIKRSREKGVSLYLPGVKECYGMSDECIKVLIDELEDIRVGVGTNGLSLRHYNRIVSEVKELIELMKKELRRREAILRGEPVHEG